MCCIKSVSYWTTISFSLSYELQVWLSPCMSTTPSTWGLITPALCCQLRNTKVLGPTSRPKTGKNKQPSVPASQLRCLQQTWKRHVLCFGHVPRSNLPPMRSWDAQDILILILKLKPFFLKRVMLEYLIHNSTCKSNSKYYTFLWITGFPTGKSLLIHRKKSHRLPLLPSQPIEHNVYQMAQL